MDTNTLMLGVIAGSIGVGYFVYGKKQQKLVPMLVGFALCIYPYFITNLWLSIAVGLFLVVLPFFWQL